MDAQEGSRRPDLPPMYGGLGPRIRAARLERGMSQDALATPHFTKSYISAVERSKVRPSLKALEFISRRLDIPVHELLAQAIALEGEPEINALEEDLAYELDHAKLLIDTGKAQDALELITQAEGAYAPHFDAMGVGVRYRFYYLRGRTYLHIGEPETSRSDLETAMELAGQLENGGEDVERARNALGSTYYEQDMPRRALEHHDRCLQAIGAGIVKNLNLKLAIHINLANDYWAVGDMNQAISVYKDSLRIVQDTANLDRQATIYWGLSLAYRDTGDLTRAKLYAAQSLGILEASQNMHAASLMRVNLAAIIMSKGELDEAERLLQETESALTDQSDWLAWSNLHEHYAGLEIKRGRVDRAEEYARRSLETAMPAYQGRVAGDRQASAHAARAYARALRTVALIEEARGQREMADSHIQEALAAISGNGFAETVSEIEFDYAEVLAARGAHQEAGNYYRAAYAHRRRAG